MGKSLRNSLITSEQYLLSCCFVLMIEHGEVASIVVCIGTFTALRGEKKNLFKFDICVLNCCAVDYSSFDLSSACISSDYSQILHG